MEKENANIVFSFLLKSAIIDWYFSILQRYECNEIVSTLTRAWKVYLFKKNKQYYLVFGICFLYWPITLTIILVPLAGSGEGMPKKGERTAEQKQGG